MSITPRSSSSKLIYLGYSLSVKKQRSLEWTKFMEIIREHNIIALSVDLDKPLCEQGRFDFIFCKFSAELNQFLGLSSYTEKRAYRLKNINDYLAKFPNTQVVDSLESQALILSRDGMLSLLEAASEQLKDVYVPRSFVVDNNNTPLPDDFPFPAFVKPITAGGCEMAHEMSIIWNSKSLESFQKPLLVQQLINHSSTLFKINVIGNESRISTRSSIKDFPIPEDMSVAEPIYFTHHNKELFAKISGEKSTDSNMLKEITDKLHKISTVLSQISGLTLYGYDMITCSKTKRNYIIDINYLPGYSGVTGIPEMLLNLFLNKISDLKTDSPTNSRPRINVAKMYTSCHIENLSFTSKQNLVTEVPDV